MRECPECRNAMEDAARFCPRCGAAATSGEGDPWVGQIVNGKFRIEALVGQGGMGRVYRAKHLTLDRPVVLKMLHKAYSSDPQIVQRFQREARAASRLDHPNSIAVLDFGEAEDGTLFMAMEYLGGRDLGRLVSEEFPLEETRIVRIGAQILSALAEAHARGIVHRDLKPENVMVEPRRIDPDFVKVLDFGIAKITAPGANEPKLTQAGLVCGTPEYMSPEQARGTDLDARTDLYSMGVILYQLATGELPFSSDTPVGFLTKHLSEIPVPPRRRRPDLAISPALDAVIARALEKDPARRFQTAEEMRDALLACAAAEPKPGPVVTVHATAPFPAPAGMPDPPPATASSPTRKPGRAVWIVAAAVVGAAGGGAFLATQRGHPDRAETSPTVPLRPVPITNPTPLTEPITITSTAPTATPTPPGAVATTIPPPLPAAAPARPAATAAPTAPAAAAPADPTAFATQAAPPASPRSDRSKALALVRRADARRAEQDVNGAIRLYLEAENADPGLAEIQKKLALCYQLRGDTRRAAERYRRYLETKPDDAERVRAILSTLR